MNELNMLYGKTIMKHIVIEYYKYILYDTSVMEKNSGRILGVGKLYY